MQSGLSNVNLADFIALAADKYSVGGIVHAHAVEVIVFDRHVIGVSAYVFDTALGEGNQLHFCDCDGKA